ncbi:adenosylcobinamide-GDP ribazoletransferase [Rhizobium sp. SG_E_25_P2]|uniref:adenosylcobinamide-GDP ribazoletransferase n=1 Tax=Rhizobium sp. SG_E_25_P2 TaxID=2879942 RepID=UPI002473C2E0|nr:adenosylcobinamide-GDP ribazoletransferase [Rhizobium sp. SG_E_25_P2]MDH6268059.1 adenosylcobinamide-GDP ribazoletransferase [Rhizobium sp. SG_E_25_P2]
MTHANLLVDTARAVGFLSRLPVPARFFDGYDGSLTRASRAFPLAGLIVAAPAGVLLAATLAFGLEPLVASVLALAVMGGTTGALHEDGLSDAADGLGATRDRDRALAIMRDSRIGSFGAAALILSYGLRTSALAAVCAAIGPLASMAALLAVAALSRAAMVWHWRVLPPARTDGLAVAMGGPDGASALFSTVSAAIIAALLIGSFAGPFQALGAMAAAAAATAGFSRYVRSRLGGQTGDTIGATQQLSEIAALLALALLT